MDALFSDTDPKMKALQVRLLRDAPAWRKLEMLAQLNSSAQLLALSGLRQRYHGPGKASCAAGWRICCWARNWRAKSTGISNQKRLIIDLANCLFLGKEPYMTLAEQIQQYVNQLPPEKQIEVLDFVAFLQKRMAVTQPARRRSLRKHPAFGSWHGRKIDALAYEQTLRSEWDSRP